MIAVSILHFSVTEAIEGTTKSIISPRKQIASGILPEDIMCSDGLVLVKKLNKETAACVKPKTAEKLIERKWGKMIDEKIIVSQNSLPGEYKILTHNDVIRELERLEQINIRGGEYIDQDQYPKTIGIYEKNGILLKEIYFCADMCPELGYVVLIFANITSSEDCKKIGGVYTEIDDPTFSIRSCEPDVTTEN